jgi:hypothetical protein
LAACAFAALSVGQASAATIEDESTPLLAIYGNPGTNKEAIPVGGGLGRNFGFGKNMLFEACATCTTPVGENLKIEFAGPIVSEAKESFIGGTLMSNKTGANNPLSFAIQFVDFQDNNITGVGAVPAYSDTFDRKWIAEVCSPNAVGEACKTDAQYTQGNKPGGVKIENVSFDLVIGGNPVVVQGTAWGVWELTKPPCIKLEKPAAGNPTLAVTQTSAGGPAVGALATGVGGKVCLVSANNDWYFVKTGESKEPAVTIANT